VIKRSGRAEQFDAGKLHRALRRVCRHRPGIGDDDIRRIARDIEARLVDEGVKSVHSGRVAQLALDRLAEIDRLSHDRLAVNYIDEDGQLRTLPRTADGDPSQLGLFDLEED
jgi:transcriptional regulator NrdR family protein